MQNKQTNKPPNPKQQQQQQENMTNFLKLFKIHRTVESTNYNIISWVLSLHRYKYVNYGMMW